MSRHQVVMLKVVLMVACFGGLARAQPAAPRPDSGAAAVEVTFRLNDAMIKNKMLGGVKVGVARERAAGYVVTGTTSVKGIFATRLSPGTYRVTYRKEGYVSVERSLTTIAPRARQTVTTTLSMMLEAAGQGGRRRVQIVLNWGSDSPQVKDADSHLMRADLKPPLHVYYKDKEYSKGKAWSVELDVDDIDWGGPETITLLDPPQGSYTYWVHDYRGTDDPLGASSVKVRVLQGDRVVGEFSAPRRITGRHWRPFKALKIDAMGDLELVPYSKQELTAGADATEIAAPATSSDADEDGADDPGSRGEHLLYWLLAPGLILILVLALVIRKLFRVRS